MATPKIKYVKNLKEFKAMFLDPYSHANIKSEKPMSAPEALQFYLYWLDNVKKSQPAYPMYVPQKVTLSDPVMKEIVTGSHMAQLHDNEWVVLVGGRPDRDHKRHIVRYAEPIMADDHPMWEEGLTHMKMSHYAKNLVKKYPEHKRLKELKSAYAFGDHVVDIRPDFTPHESDYDDSSSLVKNNTNVVVDDDAMEELAVNNTTISFDVNLDDSQDQILIHNDGDLPHEISQSEDGSSFIGLRRMYNRGKPWASQRYGFLVDNRFSVMEQSERDWYYSEKDNAALRDEYGLDQNYVDYVWYGTVHEDGHVINDIMKLKLDLHSSTPGVRASRKLAIKAIHFRNTFTRVSGSKVTGRLLCCYDRRYDRKHSDLGIISYRNVAVDEILEKSPVYFAGNIEELDFPDLFKKPTCDSPVNYLNCILNNEIVVLYDYFIDLNTLCVKGVVGENVDSMDSKQMKWVKLEDLDLEMHFDDPNDDHSNTGNILFLLIGDYEGAELEATLSVRVYYVS